jgi:glycine oxidase
MYDYLIIGGGISGLLTALELRRAGLKVCVLEKNTTGQESSWAGGGILSPLYPWRYPEAITALAQWSQAHYPSYANELHQQSGIDPEYVGNGLLILDCNEVQAAQTWAATNQVNLQYLDAPALKTCEPELADCSQALWLPEVGQLRNPRLMKSLRQAALNAGVEIREHCPALNLQTVGQQITGVITPQGIMNAAQVVVTSGAWSDGVLASLNLGLPVEPVRGQMIVFAAQAGLISRIVLDGPHYIIPRRDGHVLVGSTVEYVGFDKHTTDAALEELKYAGFNLIPRLADYEVTKHWAGLRPGSKHGIPYIGEHPEIKGLFINAGHFRNGVVLGIASARLLADIALQRTPILDPQPYRVGRFEA